MLETIRESKSFKAPLPPRRLPQPAEQYSHYGGDQDPTDREGLEYARAYHSIQFKAANTNQQAAAKAAHGSPNSDTSDQSFVCNMSAAAEPLYGDPGEEDFWSPDS